MHAQFHNDRFLRRIYLLHDNLQTELNHFGNIRFDNRYNKTDVSDVIKNFFTLFIMFLFLVSYKFMKQFVLWKY